MPTDLSSQFVISSNLSFITYMYIVYHKMIIVNTVFVLTDNKFVIIKYCLKWFVQYLLKLIYRNYQYENSFYVLENIRILFV